MKVLIDFKHFKPWGVGKEHYDFIAKFNKLDQLESLLEEVFPQPVDQYTLNDYLSYEFDFILNSLQLEEEYNMSESNSLDIHILTRDLNEVLDTLHEGEVISFTDFKRQKEAQKNLDKALHVKINKIIINWCESAFNITFFQDKEELSYEEFQKRAYVADYFLQQNEGYCKCSYTAQIEIQQGPNGNIEDSSYTGRLYLGAGKEENNILVNMEQFINENTGSVIFFDNIPVTYSQQQISTQAKMYKQPYKQSQKDLTKHTDNPLVKDYSNKGTKTAQDVQVGDILYTSYGYDMTLVDFYKVIERKNASIKIQLLNYQVVDGNGYGSGKVVPLPSPAQDSEVDGKIFRLSKNYGVCKIGGKTARYWDGTPMYYNHMD